MRTLQLARFSLLGTTATASLALALLALPLARAIAEDLVVDLGRGPLTVTVPSSYEPGTPLPLVLVLHGYSGNGTAMVNWWQLPARAEEYGFFVVHPEGTVDGFGARFWNATDACCNFSGSNVDDSQYLLDLIDEIKSQLDVDARRVYVSGHSNGGFMSHRMACDHPETVAAIGSLAGAVWEDPLDCDPDSPVHVLQIHGTSDGVIFYNGGNIGGTPYPSAVESVEYWAGVGGCSLIPDTDFPPIDIDGSIAGEETSITKYAEDCDPSGSAELWTIAGGAHSPNLNANFSQLLIEYFFAHPKPETAGTDDPLAALDTSWLTSAPNPFSTSTSIALRLEQPSRTSMFVLTASGRRIRSLVKGESLAAGTHTFPWDGRNDAGRSLPAGVYFVHVAIDGEQHSTRLIQLDG